MLLKKSLFYDLILFCYALFICMPRTTEYESTMLSIAWLIQEEADKQQWNFERIRGLSGMLPYQFIR